MYVSASGGPDSIANLCMIVTSYDFDFNFYISRSLNFDFDSILNRDFNFDQLDVPHL